MMKNTLLLLVLTALFAAGLFGQELAGEYEFYENGGRTAGGTAIFIGHSLKLGSDGTAMLSANGYQTARDLICTFKMNASKTMVYFQKYNEDGANLFEPYKPGDLLLTLENRKVKGKKVIWTVFESYGPVVKDAPKAGGVYFKPVKK